MTFTSRSICALLVMCGMSTAVFAQHETPKDKPAMTKPDMGKPAMQPGDKMPADKAGGMPNMTPEMMKEMETYMKAAQPGPMHEKLQKSVGTWAGHVKMWHEANSPAMESEGTMTLVSLMDGRFVHGEYSGDMMGMPFHGANIMGYDNVSKKFQQTWVDNMGTGMMTGTGEPSADGKKINWTMKYNDPMAGKEVTIRETDTWTSDDTMMLEMWGPGKDGKEMKMMEISYKRTSKGAELPSEGTKSTKHDGMANPHAAPPEKTKDHK